MRYKGRMYAITGPDENTNRLSQTIRHKTSRLVDCQTTNDSGGPEHAVAQVTKNRPTKHSPVLRPMKMGAWYRYLGKTVFSATTAPHCETVSGGDETCSSSPFPAAGGSSFPQSEQDINHAFLPLPQTRRHETIE